MGENDIANTTLFQILMGELEPDEGSYKWGVSTTQSYFPKDNSEYFNDCNESIIKWLEQYAQDTTETYLRGFLGKMLFSGDDVLKTGQCTFRWRKSSLYAFPYDDVRLQRIGIGSTNQSLDLESITAVNNGLIDFKGILLFASHDHQFVQTIANRIIEITDDGIIDRMTTFDEYLEAMGKINKKRTVTTVRFLLAESLLKSRLHFVS